MGQRLPIDPAAVLCNALEEAMSVGVLKFEDGVLSEDEKNESLEWIACHLLASLYSHGYQVQLAKKENDGGRSGHT